MCVSTGTGEPDGTGDPEVRAHDRGVESEAEADCCGERSQRH